MRHKKHKKPRVGMAHKKAKHHKGHAKRKR